MSLTTRKLMLDPDWHSVQVMLADQDLAVSSAHTIRYSLAFSSGNFCLAFILVEQLNASVGNIAVI